MPQEENFSATDRLVALMDHLGLGSAHFGTPIPRDISGLAAEHPERLAGIVLCVPSRLDPAPFADIAERVLMISGEHGPASTARSAAGYNAPGSWSDAIAERTQEIAKRIIAFLDGHHADTPRGGAPRAGIHAGISYQVEGSGPPVVTTVKCCASRGIAGVHCEGARKNGSRISAGPEPSTW